MGLVRIFAGVASTTLAVYLGLNVLGNAISDPESVKTTAFAVKSLLAGHFTACSIVFLNKNVYEDYMYQLGNAKALYNKHTASDQDASHDGSGGVGFKAPTKKLK